MHDGLERFPWDELHYAYGTAEDVPDLIRDLNLLAEIANGPSETIHAASSWNSR